MHSLKELPDTEGGYVAWVACEQALLRVWVRVSSACSLTLTLVMTPLTLTLTVTLTLPLTRP